jgi:hypothetical protein
MKKIYKFISIILSLLFMQSCTNDFEDINTNPNSPEEIKQVELLLPSIINSASRSYFSNTLSRGTIVCDYLEDTFTSMFASAFNATDTERYYFGCLRDVQNIIDASDAEANPHMLGIGLILKSWMFQVMTDMYGDFPYSQALKNKTEGNKYPVYDKQEDIYYDLIAKLDEANTLLGKNSAENISKDILFDGDAAKWRKFANGLRIRLLMRISGKSGLKINVAQLLQEMVANPAKYPLFESNADNAVFSFLDEEGNYAPSYTNTPADFNNSRFMTTTLAANLEALNDNRKHAYASPTKNSVELGNPQFAGVPNCLNTADEINYNGAINDNSTLSNIFLPRSIDPVIASPTAAQTIILTYSEIQLHLAEARERGLISTGNAETYYREGINASFGYWASRVPAYFTYPASSDILPQSNYMTQPAVAYTGTQAQKLEKIYTQKWIALFFCGFEGWSEWRRTGIPHQISTTPPGGYNSSSAINEWPRRIPYPQFEQNYNNKSYKEAVGRQGADNLTTRIWIDK